MAKSYLESGRFERIARATSKNTNVTVELSGTCARTNGKVIYLPVNADSFAEKDARALHGLLDHEVAHVWEIEQADATGAYTPGEAMRSAEDNATRLWLNAFEDVRIERNASERYIGTKENLIALRQYIVEKHKEALAADPACMDMWGQIVLGAIMRMQGESIEWLNPAVADVLSMLKDEIDEGTRTSSVKDCLDLARRVVAKLRAADEGKGEGGEEEEQEGEGEGEGKGEGKGEGTGDGDGESAGDGGEKSDGNSEGKDAGTSSGEPSGGVTGDTSEKSEKAGGAAKGEAKGDTPAVKKDDLSDAAKRILSDLKTADAKSTDVAKETAEKALEKVSKAIAKRDGEWIVHPSVRAADEITIPESVAGSYQRIKAKVGKQSAVMKQKLVTLLRARTQKHISGDRERGMLDTASLYSLKFNNSRVFAAPAESQGIDTAVFMLVDESGSMNDCGKSAAAKEMTVAIADALHALNIPFEIFGFSNSYETKKFSHETSRKVDTESREEGAVIARTLPFDFSQYKSFDEDFKKVRDRLDNICGKQENVDGDAVEFAAHRLISRQEKRKILIVLSDGTPCGGCRSDKKNSEHLKEVVKKTTASGIEVLGVGVLTNAVKSFYNEETGAHHIVVNNLNVLATEAFKAFKLMLAKAT